MSIKGVELTIRSLEKTKKDLRKAHQLAMTRTAADMVVYLSRVSPVDTGAYRARHEVLAGSSKAYQHPDYPEPEERFPRGKKKFVTHVRGDVLRALKGAGSFLTFRIRNRSRYANKIENGSSQQAPSGVYRLGVDYAEERAKYWAKRAFVGSLRRFGSEGEFQDEEES